jgi:WD40 repeat protein
MSVSPSGRSIYVAGKTRVGAQEGTALYRLDDHLASQGSTTIPHVVAHLAGDDSGLVFVSPLRGSASVLAVSIPEGRVVGGSSRSYDASYLHLFPDQNRLYFGTVGVSPGSFSCVLKAMTSRGDLESYQSRHHSDHPLGYEFAISPDGRFLFARNGPVLRLSGAEESDLAYVDSLPPFRSVAFSPDYAVFFASFADGTVAAYSMDDFSKPLRSYHIGWVLEEMVLDPDRDQIVGIAIPPSEASAGRRFPLEARKVGNLLSFSFAP